jgi:NhaP-type Na+/H+ or K+/H+ antiporter
LVYGTVFAAIIAATDPMAVVALFKSVGAPKRLGTLVEGESLLNDGTAVVFFGLVMAIAAGNKLSVAAATLHFIQVVGVGCTVGAVVSYAISRVIQRVGDAMVEITLTTVVAYGSFTSCCSSPSAARRTETAAHGGVFASGRRRRSSRGLDITHAHMAFMHASWDMFEKNTAPSSKRPAP